MAYDPQFLYHGWKEHELEIRFHTTLTPTKWKKVIIFAPELKKCDFHWWRHNVLRSIEVISLTGDRFSPKFWYVIAETIAFRIIVHHFSFWLRYHGQNFDQKRQVKIFHVYVLCLWEVNFFPIMNLHDNVLGAVSRLFLLHFLWNLNML